MTQYLPPNLLALFAPRDPILYLPPAAKLPFEKKTRGYSGIAQYLHLFEDPKETPPPVKIESRDEKMARKKREKAELAAYKLEQGIALWDPKNTNSATKDPFKTIFVGRINYDTNEAKLKREFETFGPIRKIRMIHDKVSGKPRGYAFIEFEHEKDMHAAYKHGDGRKIDGRRVIVDVERGRTVTGWLPRRLGGGIGGTRNREHRHRTRTPSRDRENGQSVSRPLRERSDADNQRKRSRRRSRSRSNDRIKHSRRTEPDVERSPIMDRDRHRSSRKKY